MKPLDGLEFEPPKKVSAGIKVDVLTPRPLALLPKTQIGLSV